MMEKRFLSDQCIISSLQDYYGIEAKKLDLLPIGADMYATLYKADAQAKAYFVKLKLSSAQDSSIEIVNLLYETGVNQIIPPIKTVHGTSSQRIEGFTLTVYPFINGQNGFSRNLTEKQWVDLGTALRKIHELDVPPSIQNRIRREDYSSKWREAVLSLIEAEPIDEKIALTSYKFINDHKQIIYSLVKRAEKFSQKLQNQTHKFVLCHSDIHGGNVLIENSETFYIVDWDDTIMAPKERDLMFIGGGVANVWNKLHEEELFYKGYGKTEINSALMAYYRSERIVEDIAQLGEKLLLTSEGDDRAKMYKWFIDMFAPKGVVEIALRTDEESS